MVDYAALEAVRDAMNEASVEIPDKVRRTAVACGDDGLAWLAGLARLVAELEREWNLSVGRTFSQGTEAFVAETVMADGRKGVLKIAIPGLDPSGRELRTLLAANGRGYVQVLRHDAARGVMLLERLGPQLHELHLPLDAQIEIICATLQDAWRPLPEGLELMSGAEKALVVVNGASSSWTQTDSSSNLVTTSAFRCASGGRNFSPAIPWNWGVGAAARLTGVEPEPIWQWGFIERIANGLLLKQKGIDELTHESLAVADAWASGDVW
jgi:hypothetical protein